MKNKLILVLIVSFAFSGFESGLKMFGGSAGFSKDLDDDSSILFFAPKMGGFISDNVLLEGGLTYLREKDCDYDFWNEYCVTDDEIVMSIGAKFFLEKLYWGIEYAPGIEGVNRTPAGTGSLMGVIDLTESNSEMLIWKLGTMSSIAKNIYLDVALNYQTYMDSDSDGAVNIGVGLSYFWRDED